MTSPSFSGLKVLVVEDEAIVSFLVEEMLLDLGCGEIWHASGVQQALEILDTKTPNIGVLDVNLSGALAYPIAERLARMRVPFFFATGYGKKGLAPEWAETPVIQKPFDQEALGRILASLVAA